MNFNTNQNLQMIKSLREARVQSEDSKTVLQKRIRTARKEAENWRKQAEKAWNPRIREVYVELAEQIESTLNQ